MASKKKNKSVPKHMKKMELAEMLVSFFHQLPGESFSMKQIARALQLTTHPLKMMCRDIVEEMLEDGIMTISEKGMLSMATCADKGREGIFKRKGHEGGIVTPDDGSEPIHVTQRNSAHALNGDRVRVKIEQHGRRKTAVITDIIQRAKECFVGVLERSRGGSLVLEETNSSPIQLVIKKERAHGAKEGDKVIVHLLNWPQDAKYAQGEVIERLGEAGENNTEMHAILAEFGLPRDYPASATRAAEALNGDIKEEDLADRLDMRGVTTFTIDPKDAKDFDDALSIAPLNNGNWQVGIHIADVSYYVKEGSVIDKEAQDRGTSVYLVDRTIPMLPERLCNGICSLRPDEEKMAFSVIAVMNNQAEVLNYEIVHTVIKSNRRFTYEEAQERIETGQGDYAEEILQLDRMAKQLRTKRMAAGAIDLNRAEVKFEIDAAGRPIKVWFKVQQDANQLVEEFMLLANRTVAEHIGRVAKGKKAKTLPYRIHEIPEDKKLEALNTVVNRWGYGIRTTGSKTTIAKSINKLLEATKNAKERELIEMMTLRAMQKARYSVHNKGHYGLAMDYYTHFTSPIRRYPDLMVHRLLTRYLQGGRSASETKYEELCVHCSGREELAANAERASVKYKQVEYMSERMDIAMEGVISGITEWGLYVEIKENKCEGMVPMKSIDNDYYDLDERNLCLIGRRTHRCLALGDTVWVKVVRTNLQRRQIDMELCEAPEDKKE